MRLSKAAAAALVGATALTPALGQNYPVRPVRILVGYAPGGGVDVAARIVAQGLTDVWGNQTAMGHRFFAFDKRTGELMWESEPANRPFDTNYSVPVVAEINGQRLLIAGGWRLFEADREGRASRGGCTLRRPESRSSRDVCLSRGVAVEQLPGDRGTRTGAAVLRPRTLARPARSRSRDGGRAVPLACA